jgi:rubredoxin
VSKDRNTVEASKVIFMVGHDPQRGLYLQTVRKPGSDWHNFRFYWQTPDSGIDPELFWVSTKACQMGVEVPAPDQLLLVAARNRFEAMEDINVFFPVD